MGKVRHGVGTLHSSPQIITHTKIKDSPFLIYYKPLSLQDL